MRPKPIKQCPNCSRKVPDFTLSGGTYIQMDRIFTIVQEKILNSNITITIWKQYANDIITFVRIIAIYCVFSLLNTI